MLRAKLVSLLTAVAAVASAPALAAYPEKPISLVVPYAAGGGSDIMTRAIAKTLGELTGHRFIVENRPGGAGNIATAAVARARPDGYTVLLASPGTHGINVHLFKDPGFDPLKDFAPVALVGHSAIVLFANASFPAKNLEEMIALVRKNPGKYPYGSPGAGSQHQLGVEQLKLKAGLDMPHVPYKGAGPAIIDLVAGHIPLAVAGFGPAARYVAEGKIRVIGAANAERLPSAKEVPVFAELFPGIGVGSWVGFVMPAGSPAEAIQTLSQALQKSLQDRELQALLTKIGVDVEYQGPAAFGRLIAKELPVWKELIEASGTKAE